MAAGAEGREDQEKRTCPRRRGEGGTQHLIQQESTYGPLEGLLKAEATMEKLRRADRNRYKGSRKETVPIPKGCRHKRPELGTPWYSSSGAKPHHPFVTTSLIPKATKSLVTTPQKGGRSFWHNWPVTSSPGQKLLVFQANDSDSHISQNKTQESFHKPIPTECKQIQPLAKALS